MADRKTTDKNDDKNDTLRAGVSAEQERDLKKESREGADEVVLSQHAAELDDLDLDEPGLLKELPEDGAVLDQQEELLATSVQNTSPFGRVIEDDFTGKGGTFVIDGSTGERKRQYDAVRDRKNPDKIVGYRPSV